MTNAKALQMTTPPELEPLNRLVGNWVTEATHRALPGVVVHGTASIEWLEAPVSDPAVAQRSSGLSRRDIDHRVHRRGSRRCTGRRIQRRQQIAAAHELLRLTGGIPGVRVK